MSKDKLPALSDAAKARLDAGKPTPARVEEMRRERERSQARKASAAKAHEINAQRKDERWLDLWTPDPANPKHEVDRRVQTQRVRAWETLTDAGLHDNYSCSTCRKLDYQCVCPCECECSCKLQVQCECTCQSNHRRVCTRKTGKKCECIVACSCKCRCARTQKHMMERDITKPVMVWDAVTDPANPVRRPAMIDGQKVLQSHGYSIWRSRKFGTAKKSGTRWQRPTENAALGATPRGMWEGDEYVTLNMTTAQLAAFTVAHRFVMNRVPDYKGNAKQGHLEALLTGSKGREDTHSVRMFTPQDLRKMGKKLPVKLKRGILRPIFGDN